MIRLINQVYGMDAVKCITEQCEWILPEEARPRPGQVWTEKSLNAIKYVGCSITIDFRVLRSRQH